MNDHSQFKFKLVWHFIHELNDIVIVLTMVVLNCHAQFVKQIGANIVLLTDIVQRRNSFLQLSLRRVIIRHDRWQWTCRKRKRYNTNDHIEDANYLFTCISCCNIPIANCNYSCYCEVKGGYVEIKTFLVLVIFLINPIVFRLIIKPCQKYPFQELNFNYNFTTSKQRYGKVPRISSIRR